MVRTRTVFAWTEVKMKVCVGRVNGGGHLAGGARSETWIYHGKSDTSKCEFMCVYVSTYVRIQV